jgi:hypothetical protein
MPTVATLLGRAQVDVALVCLGSLLRCSAEPVALRLHDDGTLRREDLDRLEDGLGRFTLVARAEGDEAAAEVLGGRPALAAFRRENPLAMKLIDTVLLAGEELAFCDTDVLFLRPFSGLFRLPPGAGALFMSDRQNAYSARSWHLLFRPRLALPRRANSGVLVYRTSAYDPDLLEWYLARPEHRFAPVWMEQTGWALLGWQAGCRLIDPAQVAIPEPGRPPREETEEPVALHFVGPVRSLLPGYAARFSEERSAPIEIRTLPARRCRAFDLALDEARRVVRRRTQLTS